MSRAVIHDPKDAASRFIRLLPHDFTHKPIDGSNSTFDFTAPEDSCSMDIPGCQVGPITHAEILMLDVRRAIGRQRQLVFQLELLSERGSPQLRDSDHLRTFVLSPLHPFTS